MGSLCSSWKMINDNDFFCIYLLAPFLFTAAIKAFPGSMLWLPHHQKSNVCKGHVWRQIWQNCSCDLLASTPIATQQRTNQWPKTTSPKAFQPTQQANNLLN